MSGAGVVEVLVFSLLATVSCLLGACDARPALAVGLWEVHLALPSATCTGSVLLSEKDGGELDGTFAICGDQTGAVHGTMTSNEVSLWLVPEQGGQPLRLHVSLSGGYLSGEVNDGTVEGWRDAAPEGSDTPAERQANDDDGEGEDA